MKPLFKEISVKLEPLKEGEVCSASHSPVTVIVGASGVGALGSVGAEPLVIMIDDKEKLCEAVKNIIVSTQILPKLPEAISEKELFAAQQKLVEAMEETEEGRVSSEEKDLVDEENE